MVLVNIATLREAERMIESCEHCNPAGAEIPFDNILDRVAGCQPSVTDYILEAAAKCPNCRREILEKTLSSNLRDLNFMSRYPRWMEARLEHLSMSFL